MKFNDYLNDLANYEPGKDIDVIAKEYKLDRVIKLASNENPFGTSQKVIECIKKYAHLSHLYPDDTMIELKTKIAKLYNIKTNELIIGSGSDQIIEFAVHAKLNHSNAYLQCDISFAMYGIYAKQTRCKCYKTKSMTHNLDELKTLYDIHKNEIKLVFLCVPNNPLGECLDASEIYNFIRFVDKDCLVVLDCAYNNFASFKDEKKYLNPSDLIVNFTNVLYLGTFSKLYGLGGLRIGYGIANENIINAFYKLRAPFNVTNLSLKAAVVALDDRDFSQQTLKNNFEQMKLYENFAKKYNIKYIDSYTNFITYFFKDHQSSDLALNLLKRGIIVRDLKSYELNAIRITIGTAEQNQILFDEFAKLL